MDSDDYTAPSLIGLDTKENQSQASKIVRKGATAQHKEFVSEDERIDKKLKLIIKASGLNVSNYFEGRAEKAHRHSGREGNIGEEKQRSALQYQIQPSLAEGVLQAHKVSIGVQTKKHRTTGLDHPYDI